MATTLWDKFQASVRYVNSALDRAGIVTIPGAELANFTQINSQADTAKPVGVVGADVEGFGTVDLGFLFGGAGETGTFRVYLYTGAAWLAPEADLVVTAQAGDDNVYVNALDVETFQRIFVRTLVAPASSVKVIASPRN